LPRRSRRNDHSAWPNRFTTTGVQQGARCFFADTQELDFQPLCGVRFVRCSQQLSRFSCNNWMETHDLLPANQLDSRHIALNRAIRPRYNKMVVRVQQLL
jgi:hypothetical protein